MGVTADASCESEVGAARAGSGAGAGERAGAEAEAGADAGATADAGMETAGAVKGAASERAGRGRLLVRLGVALVGLRLVASTAGAHGPHGSGGGPVTFTVVVALPIVAGLGGGAFALRFARRVGLASTEHRARTLLGLLLAGLGGTFAASAMLQSRTFGVVGAAIGILAVAWTITGETRMHHGDHADLALGAVSTHRSFEGVAIGVLYSTGAAVGLLGTVLLAGHVALETAVVAGAYATRVRRARALGAIVVVQATYAVGAVVGFGVSGVVPGVVRAFAVGVVGGVVLVVGLGETARSIGYGQRHTPVHR